MTLVAPAQEDVAFAAGYRSEVGRLPIDPKPEYSHVIIDAGRNVLHA